MVTIHRVLIVDDEPLVRNYLTSLLTEQHLDFAVVSAVGSTTEAWARLQANPGIDGVFLDIDIETESNRAGLDFALKLNQLPEKPWVVFITGYRDYAVEAFQSFPVNYLVKPYDSQSLAPTLSWIRTHCAPAKPARIAIRHRKCEAFMTEYVSLDEIVYVQKNNGVDSVKVGLANGDVLDGVNGALKEWLGRGLFQIHRRNLINLAHVRRESPRIGENQVYKIAFNTCLEELDVGPDYLQALRDALVKPIY